MSEQRVVAVELLTTRELERLGCGIARAFPVDQAPCFDELLSAIDDADRELWREPERAEMEERPILRQPMR